MTKEEIEKATNVAVKLSEHLDAKEQAMFVAGFQTCIKWLSENERLKAEMFTLEDIERAFNAGVNSQFEVKSLNKTDVLDFHARKLHQLVLSIKPPKK